jgi:hypothetical protein
VTFGKTPIAFILEVDKLILKLIRNGKINKNSQDIASKKKTVEASQILTHTIKQSLFSIVVAEYLRLDHL